MKYTWMFTKLPHYVETFNSSTHAQKKRINFNRKSQPNYSRKSITIKKKHHQTPAVGPWNFRCATLREEIHLHFVNFSFSNS